MVRDFTDEAKEKLLSQISDIQSHDWNWFTDMVGDIVFYIQKWTGLLELESDMSNVEGYHKAILDMNDTKCGDIEKIFGSVYAEEEEVAGQLETINEKLCILSENMRKVEEGISSGFVSGDAATIQKIGTELKVELKNVNATLTELQNKEETKALTSMVIKQGIEAVGDCLSVVVDIALLPVKLVGSYGKGKAGFLAEFASQSWDVLNHSFAAMESITASGMALIGLGAAAVGWKKAQSEAYKVARENAKLDGLTDYLENESEKKPNSKLYKCLAAKAKWFDVVNTGYKTVDGVRDIVDGVVDIKDRITKKEKDISETRKLLGFEFGEKTGIDLKDYRKTYGNKKSAEAWKKFNDVYRKMENEGKTASNIKQAYALADGLRKDMFDNTNEKSVMKEIVYQTAPGKIISTVDKGTQTWKEGKEWIDKYGSYLIFGGE